MFRQKQESCGSCIQIHFQYLGLMLSKPGALPNCRCFKALKISASLGEFVSIPLFPVTVVSSCLSVVHKSEFSFPL
jgi:hypothetical protein